MVEGSTHLHGKGPTFEQKVGKSGTSLMGFRAERALELELEPGERQNVEKMGIQDTAANSSSEYDWGEGLGTSPSKNVTNDEGLEKLPAPKRVRTGRRGRPKAARWALCAGEVPLLQPLATVPLWRTTGWWSYRSCEMIGKDPTNATSTDGGTTKQGLCVTRP